MRCVCFVGGGGDFKSDFIYELEASVQRIQTSVEPRVWTPECGMVLLRWVLQFVYISPFLSLDILLISFSMFVRQIMINVLANKLWIELKFLMWIVIDPQLVYDVLNCNYILSIWVHWTTDHICDAERFKLVNMCL